ncbi:hypothetical protein J9303_14430 [Bacillaceae bacterium Marseille-Q3522]|nr:hypothetical protein [Bacillaceae bacterium Marseille-Q3522]
MVKQYVKIQLKYWYLYLVTLFTGAFAFYASSIIGFVYVYYFGEGSLMSYFLVSLTFAVIATPLLLIPNIQAARAFYSGQSIIKILTAALLFQCFSMLVFFVLGAIVFNILIF